MKVLAAIDIGAGGLRLTVAQKREKDLLEYSRIFYFKNAGNELLYIYFQCRLDAPKP